MIKVLSKNKEILDALGITKWHEAGYDGSKGLVMTYEQFEVPDIAKDNVEILWEDQLSVSDNSHGYFTSMAFLQGAPNAQIKQIDDIYNKSSNGEISGFLIDTVLPWIKENQPDVGFRCLSTAISGFDNVYNQISDFCILVNSAGNDGDKTYAKRIKDECWWGIGSVFYDDNKFTSANTSSESEYVDFSSVGRFYIPDTTGNAMKMEGTSFSTPLFGAMCHLVNNLSLDKLGRVLSQKEMYEFVKENCVDINNKGKDDKSGYGVFILPDPNSIDLTKYGVNKESECNDMTTPAIWAKEAAEWAVNNEIIKGNEDGDCLWQDALTREQFATILKRYYDKFNS
jgi:hypothetical protein